jgi:hypothetical protein
MGVRSIKEAYRQYFNTDSGTAAYNAFKRLLYTEEDTLVEAINSNILQSLPFIRKDVINVCDIGGGDGNRIIRILKYLYAKYQMDYRLDFIEQSQQYIDAFDTKPISEFGVTKKYPDLFENVALPGRYDLVFLIHSIFAFENWKAVDKILSLPNCEDSKIIVVSNAPGSFLGELSSLQKILA